MKAKEMVGRSITRINMKARKTTGVEVTVTGRWKVKDSSGTGGLILGPSSVLEILPGEPKEISTTCLHVDVLDRTIYFNSDKKRMQCDGAALLVDSDEAMEREVMEEMRGRGSGYITQQIREGG